MPAPAVPPGPPRPEEPPDEAALVARLQAGDPAAFETVVRLFGGQLLAVARRLLRDEEDARDAVQDAFLSAFRAIGGFEGGSKLSTWLHRIAVNAALMKLRSHSRKAEVPQERPIEGLLPAFQEDGHVVQAAYEWRSSAEAGLDQERLRALMRSCIDQLPENHRTVLLLRDIEELDTEQSAQLLGISQSAVKVRLHRARLALRTLLDPHLRRELAP